MGRADAREEIRGLRVDALEFLEVTLYFLKTIEDRYTRDDLVTATTEEPKQLITKF